VRIDFDCPINLMLAIISLTAPFNQYDPIFNDKNDNLSFIRCLAPYICPFIFGFSNKVSGIGVRMFNA
jgi:hypothetical protein